MKIIKTLCRIIQYIVIILIILFVLIALTTIAFPKSSGFLGYKIYTVVSESMKPELTIGDVILVKEVSPQGINIGDIIVYQGLEKTFKGRIITHKVVNKVYTQKGFLFTTKGTNNDLEDPEIMEDQIYGVVEYKMVIPSLIRKAMNSVVGFILIIGLPLLAMMLSESKELRELLRNRKKRGEDKEDE